MKKKVSQLTNKYFTMKKSTKKLQLNKEVVASLDNEAMAQVKGGVLQFWTTGCTDGCSIVSTLLQCTQSRCTYDCSTGKCSPRKPNSSVCNTNLCVTAECMTRRSDCGTSQCNP